MSLFQKIVLISIQGLAVIGYTHFHNTGQSQKHAEETLKKANSFMFVLYIFNLVYVLFLDPDFGRRIISYSTWNEYLKYNVNLDLFASIQLFINGYQNGYVTLETLLRNILGNVVVFMPMAYFLPLFFKKFRKWYLFIIAIFFIVFGVELLQVLLRIGSGDIDDLFLNILGALILYIILKLTPISRLYKKIGRD